MKLTLLHPYDLIFFINCYPCDYVTLLAMVTSGGSLVLDPQRDKYRI
jgi:hypothetical protein